MLKSHYAAAGWIAAAVSLCLSMLSCGPRRPESYKECVQNALKVAKGDKETRLAVSICGMTFPDPEDVTSPPPATVADVFLSPPQMEKIAGHASLHYSTLSVRLHNGNEDVVITELELDVTTMSPSLGKAHTRTYRHRVTLGPLSTASFKLEILIDFTEEELSGWKLKSAKGQTGER